VALPCGSASTTSTRRSGRAINPAKAVTIEVLPTPPFWLATSTTRASAADSAPCVDVSGSITTAFCVPVGLAISLPY
jgi:hypothetical protein